MHGTLRTVKKKAWLNDTIQYNLLHFVSKVVQDYTIVQVQIVQCVC